MNKPALWAMMTTVIAIVGSPGSGGATASRHLHDPPKRPVEKNCGHKSYTETIKITLHKKLDTNNPRRDIVAESDPLRQLPLPDPPLSDDPSPLDIDLKSYLTPNTTPGTNVVLIRIELKDPNFRFARMDLDKVDPVEDAEDGIAPSMFCELTRKNDREVQFYVRYAMQNVGSFAIAVKDLRLSTLDRTFIDPHVGNNGLALTGAKRPTRHRRR